MCIVVNMRFLRRFGVLMEILNKIPFTEALALLLDRANTSPHTTKIFLLWMQIIVLDWNSRTPEHNLSNVKYFWLEHDPGFIPALSPIIYIDWGTQLCSSENYNSKFSSWNIANLTMLGNHYDKNHKNHSTVAITNSTIRCQMIFTNACLFSDKNQRTQLLRWAITRTQVRPPRQSPIGQLCLRDGLPLSSARQDSLDNR